MIDQMAITAMAGMRMMTEALVRDRAAPTPPAEPKTSQWTRIQMDNMSHVPAPRSGHAMTVLSPSKSVLVFGGSNGRTFFDDFHVLEPVHYAALDPQPDNSTAPVWKKLVVSFVTAQHSPAFLSTSFGSDSGASGNASQEEDPSTGCGRDYHTMHYVPSASPEEEKQRGFRVLVVGNAIVSGGEDEDVDGSVAAHDQKAYDSQELRIDEVWIKQPLLEAQWIVRPIKCMWKPCPRQGHCTALLGDQLFCFGGKNVATTMFYDDFFYFNVAVNQWRELPPAAGSAPSARAFADMTVCPSTEQLFVYGGHDDKQQFGGLYLYDIQLHRWDKVSALGEKPATRINHTLTFAAPHALVLFGGRTRTTRRNDTYLFDMSLKSWRQCLVHGDRASQRTKGGLLVPVGRTAHAAVILGEQLLIFGGYAGSHSWLNDLHTLPLGTFSLDDAQPKFVRRDQGASSSLSTSSGSDASRERPTVTTRGPSPATHSTSSRPSSRASNDQVLTDITNRAPPPLLTASSVFSTSSSSLHGVSTGVDTTSSESSVFLPAYTPAAVAARKRRLAEMSMVPEAAAAAPPPPSERKQRRRPRSTEPPPITNTTTNANTSQHQSLVLSQQPLSQAETIGVQTMLVQLLQHQQRMDENMARLASVVTTASGSRQQQHEAITNHQVFLHKQNDRLETQLDVLTRRYEAMEHKVHALEREKRLLQDQLVAAETEVYVYKKNVEELLPQVGGQVQRAIEKVTQAQLTAAHLIQAKLSNLHDLVEEVRNASGERTETDESPMKKDSIFPDEMSGSLPLSAPAVLYPQTVVRELEHKLHDAVTENLALNQRVAVLEEKLRRAEGNAQRIQELSLAWLHSESKEADEYLPSTTD